jgi:hypothetical protein
MSLWDSSTLQQRCTFLLAATACLIAAWVPPVARVAVAKLLWAEYSQLEPPRKAGWREPLSQSFPLLGEQAGVERRRHSLPRSEPNMAMSPEALQKVW